ncbi:MAG TPA: hypothetical protein VNX28_10215 [Gemmataceae bacterium]|jgi:hypothetical protein|nr:hypothetical protein [Gemmataceae bacterium]
MYDLSRLSDDEIALLERILKKAAGGFEGEITPFKIEFVERGQSMIDSNAVEPS